MPEVTVLGGSDSSAERFGRKLADALGTTFSTDPVAPAGVRLAWPSAETGSEEVLVLIDDAPQSRAAGRGEAMAATARARAAGAAVRVFCAEKPAFAWIKQVAAAGLPDPTGPLQRLYLASGEGAQSEELAHALAAALGVPLVEPEAEHPGHDYSGWGPRYEALAGEERWLIHSPTWHAVEPLCERADLVVLDEPAGFDPKVEFPAPQPESPKWRRLFAPWLSRYPGVEARLLERELARHSGDAPVLRLRTAEERVALLAAFKLPAAR